MIILVTATVADYSNETNNNNDTNEQKINITLRRIDLSEDMERKFEEGNDTDG